VACQSITEISQAVLLAAQAIREMKLVASGFSWRLVPQTEKSLGIATCEQVQHVAMS